MIRSYIFVPVLIVAFLSLNCSSFSETGINFLAEGLRMQLKNGKFGEIYDSASNQVHLNVSREDFIQRSQKIVNELKKVDEGLDWSPDNSLGYSFRIDRFDRSTTLAAFRKLGPEANNIHILIYWSDEDGQMKLNDLTAQSLSFQIITVGKIVESK